MTVLLIIGAVLLFILILLLLPVTVRIWLDGDFFLKIKYAGITVYSIKPEKDEKRPKPADTESDKKAEEQGDNFFKRLVKERGFSGAVKTLADFASAVLGRLRHALRRVRLRRIILKLTAAADDAAKTALEYGAVCTAVYPVLSLIDALADVRYREINVSADFNAANPELRFSADIKLDVLTLISALRVILYEYRKRF